MGLAGLIGLLRLQWIAYWRRISRAGTAGKNNLVVLGLITLMGGARYFTVLKGLTLDARKGNFAGVDLLAAGVLAVCLMPLWDEGSKNIGPRDLSRFPLTAAQRFVARIWGRVIAPMSWIAGLFCLSLFAPLAVSSHSFCAVTGGVAFLWMSWMLGLSASHFLSTARGKAVMTVLLVMALAGAALLWFRMGRGSAAALTWLPSHLVTLTAQGSWAACASLAALALACSLFAFVSLTWMLETAPAAVTRKTVSSPRITVLGKEVRYFARMETVVWLILAAFAFYLATAAAPEADALRAVLMFTSIFTAGSAMNSFGPDGTAGLDRYALWPLTGWQVIATKNRAAMLLACARWSPILILACWRFGWHEAMYGTVEAASLVLATLAWGNVTSVRHPSSGSDAGESLSLIDQMIALVASGLPGALTIGILRGPGSVAPAAMFGMLAVCGALYAVSLRWSADYYRRSFDTIREWMA